MNSFTGIFQGFFFAIAVQVFCRTPLQRLIKLQSIKHHHKSSVLDIAGVQDVPLLLMYACIMQHSMLILYY